MFNDLLELYRTRLSRSTISFPCSALRCLDALRSFTGGRLLLLTADKGHIHDETVLSRTVPAVAVHSISMDVNHHLIAFVGAGSVAACMRTATTAHP